MGIFLDLPFATFIAVELLMSISGCKSTTSSETLQKDFLRKRSFRFTLLKLFQVLSKLFLVLPK